MRMDFRGVQWLHPTISAHARTDSNRNADTGPDVDANPYTNPNRNAYRYANAGCHPLPAVHRMRAAHPVACADTLSARSWWWVRGGTEKE